MKTIKTFVRFVKFVAAALTVSLIGCGDENAENYYAAPAASGSSSTVINSGTNSITVKIRTSDQFGNPVSGQISYGSVLLGTKEAELTFDPKKGGSITFGKMEGFVEPPAIDLSLIKAENGQIFDVAYTLLGKVASICARPYNSDLNVVDAQVTVNGQVLDFASGHCMAADVSKKIKIRARAGAENYAPDIYIPADTLKEGQTYSYKLVFVDYSKTIYINTTPLQGEVFVNSISRGWAENPEDFIYQPLYKGQKVKITFGDIPGHKTPKGIEIDEDKVKNYDSSKIMADQVPSHYWGLYDDDQNCLACFTGLLNDQPTYAQVKLDGKKEYTSAYDTPACIGLAVNTTHKVEFLPSNGILTKDKLEISSKSHEGCEGEFVANGGRLDCFGEYYYEPAAEKELYYYQLQAIAPHKGNVAYPTQMHYEIDGIQYTQGGWSEALKKGEKVTIKLLPIGVMQPNISTLTIDTHLLSPLDEAYQPQSDNWLYTIKYQPPADAKEVCVTAYNQNDVSVSTQVGVKFDGNIAVTNYAETEDCGWLSIKGNHVITAEYLAGYQVSRSPLHIPEGKALEKFNFSMLYIPEPTMARFCVLDVPVEEELWLNGYHMAYTNEGDNCVWLDRAKINTVKLGEKVRVFPLGDTSLSGPSSLNLYYSEF